MTKFFLHYLAVILPFLAGVQSANAQLPSGIGERSAKEAFLLVSFAEMGNIGSRDSECTGHKFPITNIDSLIEMEIVPFVRALAKAERKENPAQIAELSKLFKQGIAQKINGVGVVQTSYDQLKREYRSAFGSTGVCSNLVWMVQSSIDTKRQALLDIKSQLSRVKP